MKTPRETRYLKTWLLSIAILIIAAALRSPQLDGPRFHPDEALFASFARSIAVWRDPLLAHAPVDKPPFLFYLQALCYPFLGPREMAARLPNYYASILTVALTMAITCKLLKEIKQEYPSKPEQTGQLYYHAASFLAGLFVTLSPITVALSPTAFTDSLMVMWGMAALLTASGKKPAWSGLWLGLGLATKYQAILFAPLVLFLILKDQKMRFSVLRFLVAVSIPVGAVIIWDMARVGSFTLINKQISGYGGFYPVPFQDLCSRLMDWFRASWFITGSTFLGVVMFIIMVVWSVYGFIGEKISRLDRLGWIFSVWLLFYAIIHWLFNIQIWDRYLLPAVPIAAVLAGFFSIQIKLFTISRQTRSFLLAITLLTILPASVGAMVGELPTGWDHSAYEGIEQVAEYFDGHPYGTVLYDHWLSWELGYYLFDSRVFVSWFPDSSSLIADLQAFGALSPRFIIIPSWKNPSRLLETIQENGFTIEQAFATTRSDQTVSFVIWKISP